MFNTLGNLAVDPAADLLLPDFATGRTLQLSGAAITEWTTPGVQGDDDASRLVHFTIDQVAACPALKSCQHRFHRLGPHAGALETMRGSARAGRLGSQT
jgi:hypothetical protein